jgi:glycosyltransferase involved in cell wall biosynthesis
MKVLTAYFNPCGYRSRRKNYHLFKKEIEKSGVELLTMELAQDDSQFEIDGSIRFKGNPFLWQKENLITKGMELIDDEVFAWIDCDLLFHDSNWVEKTLQKLENNDVVQLFDTVTLLDMDGKGVKTFKSMAHEFIRNPSFKKGHPNQGHPGFAFAGKKKKVKFYTENFLFSNDVIFCSSLTHDYWIVKTWNVEEKLKDNVIRWCESNRDTKFSFLDAGISHLWHGPWSNRQYNTRMDIVRTHGKYVTMGDDGFYSCQNKETENLFENFFKDRKEDQGQIMMS